MAYELKPFLKKKNLFVEISTLLWVFDVRTEIVLICPLIFLSMEDFAGQQY